MVDISAADLDQLYAKSIIMYKGRPARVLHVDRNKDMHMLGLISGKKNIVPFKQADFKPSLGRIGFINNNGHAFYAVRNPSRRFSIGLTTSNVAVHVLEHRNDRWRVAYDQVMSMNVRGWGQALLNDYPTFRDAITIAKENGGSCAFDKQFAVDSNRNIYFKQKRVGVIPSRMSTTGRILFDAPYQFLEILVENHYDKTVRTFAAA